MRAALGTGDGGNLDGLKMTDVMSEQGKGYLVLVSIIGEEFKVIVWLC